METNFHGENSMKFSIVCPTMWMANQFFLPMLNLMVKSEEIGEIIIVDNNSSQRPDDDNLKHEKIKILDYGKNLYFNKSMNVGVENSKFEILCLLNDDVIFDPFVFKVLSESYTQNADLRKNVGMIYPHPEFFNRFEEHQELAPKLKLVECVQRLDGFGCCMFVLKEHYTPVPEELVQHFGDVWYHKTQLKQGRKNYWLYNWVIGTKMRTTTAKVPEIKQIINNDWKIAGDVFAKHEVELEDHSHTRPIFNS
jgi:glycosyltransferase involved in cell wall biosynthesis